MKTPLTALLILAGLTACSGEDRDGDHVWQTQTDALKQAGQVEQLILDKAQRDRTAIEQQSR